MKYQFRKKLLNMKAAYFFNALALSLLIISIIMFKTYQNTKNEILRINYENNIAYVKDISKNIDKDIQDALKKDFYTMLSNDKVIQDYINSRLKLFITKKYKYIYLVDKKDKISDDFRFLADGSAQEHERSEFAEIFKPIHVSQWNKVFKTKKALLTEKTDIEGLWSTYLHPIIVNDKVEAILVVDFSSEEQNKILLTLHALGSMFTTASIFFLIIFVLILWFSYMDNKREKEKNDAFKLLEKEALKVKDLNENLESKVKEELEKNELKDKQLVQQSRLAQMGEMLSMIAHQWRQPLSVISSTSISLGIKAEFDQADKETVLKYTKDISEYSQHLSSTIDDFRNFFKPDKIKELTTYNSIIDAVLRIIEVDIDSHEINLIKNLSCDEIFESYPNELKQVLLNLVKNAQDAIVDNKIKNPYIKISTYKEDEKNILEVLDNAGGIDKNNIDKIFDPYFSTKLAKNGTGIGLYMSKMIIEKHCFGELNVESDKDGAVFKIVL